jgi:hypothetical protein
LAVVWIIEVAWRASVALSDGRGGVVTVDRSTSLMMMSFAELESVHDAVVILGGCDSRGKGLKVNPVGHHLYTNSLGRV